MAAKSLLCSGVVTGSTVYAIIRREADGYLLDDADGAFAAAPADPFVSLSEHGTIKGLYTVSESRAVWDDGVYTTYFYKQAGGSPAPATDGQPVASGPLYVRDDTEIDAGELDDRFDAVDADIVDVQADTDDIQTRLPAALVAGRMDSSVEAYATGLVPLQPTVAGRTLDVSTGGEAGIDWANVGTPGSTVDLSDTTVKNVVNITGSVAAITRTLKTQLDALTKSITALVKLELGKITSAILDIQRSVLRGGKK